MQMGSCISLNQIITLLYEHPPKSFGGYFFGGDLCTFTLTT